MPDPLKLPGLSIHKELDELSHLRGHIQKLTAEYIKKQAVLLRAVQEKGEAETVALLAQYLRQGANLRWGARGWEIEDTAVRLPTRVVEHLYGLGFAQTETKCEWHDLSEKPLEEIVGDLLSNDAVRGFRDDLSRRAYRANQSRAYFKYLARLLILYQEHSVLRGAVSYPAVLREKIQFTYNFAWLYFAGILHWARLSEALRIRIAQGSLEAIAPLIG